MKYKFLAFLTAVVLVFGITPAGITRATEDAADSRTVKLLSALGIMDADSHTGKFWDNTPVERQEMAKILCNLFDLEVSTDTLPRFNDVHEDYRAHVETAVRNGYMLGQRIILLVNSLSRYLFLYWVPINLLKLPAVFRTDIYTSQEE